MTYRPKNTTNVKDYFTNDIQTIVNLFAGRKVYFPRGVYTLTDEIIVPPQTTIVGDGTNSTIFHQTTPDKRVFYLLDSPRSAVEDVGVIGSNTTGELFVPVIEVGAVNVDIEYACLRNIEVKSMGSKGIGVLLRSSSQHVVAFSSLENLYICGGNPNEHSNKIGIRVGALDPSLIVLRIQILGGRVWRCQHGIQLMRCDTVMEHGTSFDDISDTALDFIQAGGCNFTTVGFENGTIGKYIDFRATSADNYVKGYLGNATPQQVTNAGIRNSWDGTDGAGGLVNFPLPNVMRLPVIVQ